MKNTANAKKPITRISLRLAALILSALVFLSFFASSCGGKSGSSKGGKTPEDSFVEFFEALQKGNVDIAQGYLATPEACPVLINVTKKQSKTIAALVSNASYTELTATEFEAGQIDDEETAASQTEPTGAILQVTIKNKDFSQISARVSSVITSDLSAFAAKKEAEKQKFIQESISSAMAAVSERTETTVSVLVTQIDGAWKIQDASELGHILFGDGALLDL